MSSPLLYSLSPSKCLVAIAALGLGLGFLTAAPTKILLIGDSITQGGTTSATGFGYVGYRYPLYYELQGLGYSFDFVGNRNTLNFSSGNSNSATPNPALYPDYNTTFDKDHNGVWGITTQGFNNNNGSNSWANLAAALKPDVATIHLGTNDLASGSTDITYAAVMTNMGQIVDKLRAQNANVKIVLAQIIPRQGVSMTLVNAYNSQIAALAASKNTAQSPIVLVDQSAGFDTNGQTSDGTHPNQYGEQLMADRFAIGLQKVMSPGQPIKSPDIHLGNASFDDVAVADGTLSAAPLRVAWTFATTSASAAGILNPGSTSYTGASANGVPLGAAGANVAYIMNNQAAGSGIASISQTIGAVLSLDTRYDLTIAIGNRAAGNPFASIYGGYRIELLAGGTVIGFEENAFTPAAGMFEDASFSVSANDLDSSLLGQSFSVRMTLTSTAAQAATDFDNLRLTAVAVPEPDTLGLFFAGLLGLLAFSRRGHRAPQ